MLFFLQTPAIFSNKIFEIVYILYFFSWLLKLYPKVKLREKDYFAGLYLEKKTKHII